MKFHSTRGRVKGLTFEQVLLSGYASDGGMLLPESVPTVDTDTLKDWAGLHYRDLAFEVISLFITREEIPEQDLKDLLSRAFSTFSVPEIVPITKLSDGLNIAELYHGRSLAFKDLAMSCMGQLYSYFLKKKNQHMTLLVPTSGDTGSAAIEAVRGMDYVDVVVLLPRGRITDIQERMMTTVLDSNIHVIRADGTSDDIDVLVRDLFADPELVSKHCLGSPSSLNFTRILIQIAHFFYMYLKLCPKADQDVEMILPTGGGGNFTAGMIAKKMGLGLKFVCAVNHNNILSRILDSGQCGLGDVETTLAPAMDIQFPYNFERVWYMCSDGDSEAIRDIMDKVDKGKVELPSTILNKMKSLIEIYTVRGDEEIKETLKRCWTENQYNICPHTAVGVAYFYRKLTNRTNSPDEPPSIVLATASPLKFPEAIEASGIPAPRSERIKEMLSAPVRYTDLEKDQDWSAVVREKIETIHQNLKQRI